MKTVRITNIQSWRLKNTQSIVSNKTEKVIDPVNAKKRIDIGENRKRLLPTVQTIRFCGRQQISLRGHRDNDRIGLEKPDLSDGNFPSYPSIQYPSNSGDTDLWDQLMSSDGKSMYTSFFIQNELINTIAHSVQTQIVNNVKKSVFYSVFADKTTDISQTEQFSLCINASTTHVWKWGKISWLLYQHMM